MLGWRSRLHREGRGFESLRVHLAGGRGFVGFLRFLAVFWGVVVPVRVAAVLGGLWWCGVG